MRGSLFKRWIDCGRVVQHKRCGSCGSRRYNWGYAEDIGSYADGRRRQQRRNGFETAEEAERALREVVSAIDKQSFVEPSQLTLGDYLTEHWLPAVQPPQLRMTTWVEYDRMVRLRVVPDLGQVPLRSSTPRSSTGSTRSCWSTGVRTARAGCRSSRCGRLMW